MSYRIEYQWALFRVPPGQGNAPERFVVAIEGGDNNCVDSASGKRSRQWEVGMIGTEIQVMKTAVLMAGGCEDGILKPLGRDCTPESYIRRIRRLLEAPPGLERGWWSPRLRVPPSHTSVSQAKSLGLQTIERISYGEPEAIVHFESSELSRFFEFVDCFPDVRPWRFAEVGGLPRS